MKEKLLLHVCCAPCGVYPITLLQDRFTPLEVTPTLRRGTAVPSGQGGLLTGFNLTLVFYGPNIHPEEEYKKRWESVSLIAKIMDVPLVELEYDADNWHRLIKGLDDEPEGGKRCSKCYEIRLDRTARFAKENGYEYFSATLTLSPHKPADIINPIGESIAKKYGLVFLAEDFKKKGGFGKSCELSKKYGLYRQKYCGCEYSKKKGLGD